MMKIMIAENSIQKCHIYATYINSIIPGTMIDHYRSFEGAINATIESYRTKSVYDLVLIGYYLSEHEYNSNTNVKHKYRELFETCLSQMQYPAKIIIIDGDTMAETNKHYEEIKSIIYGGN